MEHGNTPKPAAGRAHPPLTYVLVVVGLVGVLLYFLRLALVPFVLAGGLAVVGRRAMRWLERHWNCPHWAAVVIVFLIIVVISAGLTSWVGFAILGVARRLAALQPDEVHALFRDLLGGEQIRVMGQELTAEDLTQRTLTWARSTLTEPAHLARWAVVAITAIPAATLVLVLLFYFLYSGDRLLAGVLQLAPPERRTWLRQLVDEIEPVLFDYLRGVLIVVTLTAAFAWLWLRWILQVPNATLLAVLTGLLELIPVIGPTLAIIVVGVVALGHSGLYGLLLFGIYCTVLRLTIDQLVGPIVLGRAAKIHPVTVIFAMLMGGVLFGLFGLLLAVPVARCTQIVLERYYRLRAEPPDPA